MSQPDNEEPPAYTPYDRDATAGQTGAYQFSKNLTGDIDTILGLGYEAYGSCIKHVEAFEIVAHDVAALVSLLDAVMESIEKHGINHEAAKSARIHMLASKSYMTDLEAIATKYDDLSTAGQREWVRNMGVVRDKGQGERIVTLRGQIRKTIESLVALNKDITRTSPKGVTGMLKKFMGEVRMGQRKQSIAAKKGFALLDVEDITTRLQIQQELEDVGITSQLFSQYHDLIFLTLKGGSKKDSPTAIPTTMTQESHIIKTLQGIKVNSSPYENPQSLGPSNTPSGTKYDLFNAISRDDPARVEELLDQGVDIESRYESQGGKTPLMVAVGYDKVDIAELLLLRGADTNARTFHSEETALMSACSSGRSQIITLILEHGNPDLEARDRNGRTALMMASVQGYEREIRNLVKAGADMEVVDNNGRTALMAASRLGRSGAVGLLRKFGAKRN